jgi:hypothetical protein
MDDEIPKLDCTLPDFETRYGRVLNFLHYEVDTAILKNELIRYASSINMQDVAESLPLTQIGIESSIAYCLNRGAKLKESSVERLKKFLINCQVEIKPEIDWEPITLTTQGKNIQAYVDCYSHIDNAMTRVTLDKMSSRDLAVFVRKIVADRANNKSVITKQLFEHYRESLVNAKQDDSIASWVKPLSTIVDTLGLLVNNRASVKAGAKGARARIMSSTLEDRDRKGEKAAAKVTYKDEDIDLGINSVDPTNLVGATAAVIYNTKNRHCEVYFAEDGKKLSVNGSKIINFDEKKSVGRTLRNPEADLPHWNRAPTVRRLEVLLGQIKGKNWNLTGKFNRNTMILKVL